MEHVGSAYHRVHRASLEDPERFWLEAAAAVDWEQPPQRALDSSRAPLYEWFPGATLNTCHNAVDRHVQAGHGERTALIHDSAMTGTKSRLSYAELLERVSRFAGVLRDCGVTAGDRVVIYLPMIPEAVVAMLACARIGAVHSVVFGGFAAPELAARIDDCTAVALVTASGGLEPGRVVEYLPIVAEALALSAGSVRSVVVKAREHVPGRAADHDATPAAGVRWLDWDEQCAQARPAATVPVAAGDPLYVLYTSGTTASPKGIVRDNGGHAVALAWSMAAVYDIGPGDVMWAASDVGWVVGHSYIVYAPLLVGATTVLYEGKPVGTPDAGAFWRVAAEHRVNVLFTAPTALRAIRRADPGLDLLARHDLSSLRTLFLAGERLDPETFAWAERGLHCPVVDHWWQTETGWPVAAVPRGLDSLPVRAGSAGLPVPGYRVEVVDGQGNPRAAGEEGNIVLRLPLPPGSLRGLWAGQERYRAAYLTAFPGCYATGDSGHFDEDGYLYVMGRTDDVINVAGHRLSTGQLEEVLATHPAVAEAAVIGVRDELKGQRASGFVTLKAGVDLDEADLRRELVALVRRQVGPVAAFRDVLVVQRLPKTRSGKILRKTMRQIVDGDEVAVPPTIEEPAVVDDLLVAVDRYRASGAAGG
ncbi:propionyl-CoA synthetase [Kineococcus xinjiangensis]|uniref:Propionyl-CoA synthetase n=1 Tax=Kineococcus xinjiangensis TaxID=512762 RepID=A0A2S6IKE6_9ACTN|nr:AMP-binding protein [Kineococcus xinjiangensis]PPK94655.1 propionyl-CoA synthetase [Kineococcus xinjiangensis]